MSVQQRKVFRIEKYVQAQPAPAMDDMLDADMFSAEPEPATAAIPVQPVVEEEVVVQYDNDKQQEILEAIQKLSDEFSALKLSSAQAPAASEIPEDIVADDDPDRIAPLSAKDIEDARKLRAELKEIYDAIEQTKVEILTIHQSGVNGMEISRVTDELGAIVSGTETATETILEAAEGIDQSAADLVATLTDETTHGLASDIQDGVVKIFESCNFQDLTGQRISKVISAFRFIEERVIQMMEIWGGVDSFDGIETEDREDRQGDRALLNGPALNEDDNVASQDDIDALFD